MATAHIPHHRRYLEENLLWTKPQQHCRERKEYLIHLAHGHPLLIPACP